MNRAFPKLKNTLNRTLLNFSRSSDSSACASNNFSTCVSFPQKPFPSKQTPCYCYTRHINRSKSSHFESQSCRHLQLKNIHKLRELHFSTYTPSCGKNDKLKVSENEEHKNETDSKNISNDNSASNDTNSSTSADTTTDNTSTNNSSSSALPDAIDEEALLQEYYETYKEEVWKSEVDDEREVKWMEMLGSRGKEGVFDLHEIVDVLRFENVADICCIRFPEDINYADYLVIGTGISFRQLKAVMEYVRKLYKAKKHKKDPSVKIEGLESADWLAMDMGNIALHLFLPKTREEFDLESLWTLGEEFDPLSVEARTKKTLLDATNWDDDADEGLQSWESESWNRTN